MRKILTGVLLFVATLPMVAFAQFTNFDTALTTLDRWIDRLIPFLLLLATLYFFWGLARFILHASEEEARADAKQTMIWGVVTIFVMVSFWGLVGFIARTLNLQSSNAAVISAPTNINSLVPW